MPRLPTTPENAAASYSGRVSVPLDRPGLRVVVVAASDLTRRGLVAVLADDPQIEMVGQAGAAGEALRRSLAVRPDLAVVADAHLCEDLWALAPGVRCLVLGQDDSPNSAPAAVLVGAAGYLPADVHSSELLAAVHRVAAGATVFDTGPRAQDRRDLDDDRQGRLLLLSDRELDVLRLLGDGLTNRVIGGELALAEKTVKNRVSTLLAKLGLANRTQAAVLATQLSRPRRGQDHDGMSRMPTTVAPRRGYGRRPVRSRGAEDSGAGCLPQAG